MNRGDRGSDPELPAWLELRTDTEPADVEARSVSGADCRTRVGLIRALSRALSFPAYAGENWDAVADCLTDVVWPAGAAGGPAAAPGPLVIEVYEAAELLVNEAPAQLATFLRLLDEIARAAGTGWPSPPAPGLRLVLRCPEPDLPSLRDRVRAAWPGPAGT